VAATDLDLSQPIELIVLSLKERAARCRLPGTYRVISLRASRLWDIVPGEIAVVKPRKQWSYAGHPYLSGEIESSRLDVAALGLTPLALKNEGEWDPKDEYWGEEGEPIDDWAKPIIARGPRQAYEMEQVVPGRDPDDFDSDHRPKDAIRHYEVGVRIGELSLPPGFDGLLLWGHIDIRPFLRCLHVYGLCLWRLERFAEAERVFYRMLWLNPSDNQGVRFLIDEVRARTSWEDREER
jgi:hypothetical protein